MTHDLDGEVDLDRAYVNGHVRPKNKKADQVDRRLVENQKPDNLCVFVMRSCAVESRGSKRTLTYVMKTTAGWRAQARPEIRQEEPS